MAQSVLTWLFPIWLLPWHHINFSCPRRNSTGVSLTQAFTKESNMCLVALGLFNCGHGRVLVSHPATKKCYKAANKICVPENEIPDFGLVSEYILVEGPTYNRTDKMNIGPSVRTMCQLPGCDNFRPNVRCVELILKLLRSRIGNFQAAFAWLTKEYQSLDVDLARRHAPLWFCGYKQAAWSYEYALSRLEETMPNLEEYHGLCIKHSAMGDAWDGLILNPIGLRPYGGRAPKYRCFPAKTFNKATCFTRKTHAKLDTLLASLLELQALQDTRNDQRAQTAEEPDDRLPRTIDEKMSLIEELFAENDEMAGIDREEVAAFLAEHRDVEAALALPPPLSPDSSLSGPTLLTSDSAPTSSPAQLSPYAREFFPGFNSQVSASTSPGTDVLTDPFSDTNGVSTLASSLITLPFPTPRGLKASLYRSNANTDEGNGNAQPATLADLVATSEPLTGSMNLPTPPGAIGEPSSRSTGPKGSYAELFGSLSPKERMNLSLTLFRSPKEGETGKEDDKKDQQQETNRESDRDERVSEKPVDQSDDDYDGDEEDDGDDDDAEGW